MVGGQDPRRTTHGKSTLASKLCNSLAAALGSVGVRTLSISVLTESNRLIFQIEIIKKFIFDYLRLIDEYRKEKRRRDFSSSDDDDDPFHNKSSFGFGMSAARNRLNATPGSSSIAAGSIAGRSRTSTIKGNAGPVNISAAGGKSVTPAGEQEFTEEVGDCEEYKLRLKELWTKRTQLMKVTKKKKKKKRGVRSALKKTQ